MELIATDSNLWTQISIRSHRFESAGTDCNMWPQIRIGGNALQSSATDLIFGNRLQSVVTDSNLWEHNPDSNMWPHICNPFPQIRIGGIRICGSGLQSVTTDSNLWKQIRTYRNRLQQPLWSQIQTNLHVLGLLFNKIYYCNPGSASSEIAQKKINSQLPRTATFGNINILYRVLQ